MPPPTTEQLVTALGALRAVGFFPSRGALSTADLLQTIQAEHSEDWLYRCAHLANPAALDQLLVGQGRERVWSRDDLRLIEQINGILRPGGVQLAVCDDFLPDGNFIVALRSEEVTALLLRGWGIGTEWVA